MKNPSAPLYEGLLEHNRKNRISFHTPGHKDGRFFHDCDLLKMDVTELPDTDALYEASGIILQAEQAAAALFGAARTLFSAGGCTLCIQAMLRLLCPKGGRVLFGRNLHRSAVHAMALLGIDPVWGLPRPDAGTGLPGRIAAEEIKHAVEENPDLQGVYLTTPDYYGCLTDLRELGGYLKGKGIPLVLDCAHGSHLPFIDKYYYLEIREAAAMVACSAHKTLPVLTGGAYLHIFDEAYVSGAKQAMALFGSTSPAYPVMASLDRARAWLEWEETRPLWSALEERVRTIKNGLLEKGFDLPVGRTDPVRLTFSGEKLGYTGKELAEHLRAQGIEPEFSDGGWVVLIPTLMNREGDFLRLEQALGAIYPKTPLKLPDYRPFLPKKVLSPREALLSEQVRVPLEEAAGRIAADSHCPCPPGVPVVMPGERLEEKSIEILRQSGILTVNVI